MPTANVTDKRQSPRRLVNRVMKILVDDNAPPRDCLLADISTGGVQLCVEGFEVPDEFVLLLSGNGLHRECRYRVVWRVGRQIGAKSLGRVRHGGATPSP